MRSRRTNTILFVLNLAAKALLVGMLVYGALNEEQTRFAGKGFVERTFLFPIALLLVPLFWRVRGSRPPYPHGADIVLASPFIIDIGGNVLDLYNTIVWFDDAAHAVTWALLTLAIGLFVLRLGLAPWNVAWLCAGFGAITNILWEVIEYVLMVTGSHGLQLTYGDTIGDMALSLAGSMLAGIVCAVQAARAHRAPPLWVPLSDEPA